MNAAGGPSVAEYDDLLELWAAVLGRPAGELRPDDDFLRLGGTSMQAARVSAEIKRRLGVKLTIREVLNAGTLRGLADLVASQRTEPAVTGEAGKRQDAVALPGLKMPVTPLQEIIYRRHVKVFPDYAPYELVVAFELHGDLDVATFLRACEQVQERHDAFRLVFEDSPEGLHQVVQPPDPAVVRFVDLSTMDPAGAQEEAERIRADVSRPFDLTAEPQFRVVLVRMSQSRHLFYFATSHIVFDGWSYPVLYGELAERYRAGLDGDEPVLPAAPSFTRKAAEIRAQMGTGERARIVEYWKRQVGDYTRMKLTESDSHTGELESFATVPFEVDGRVREGLTEVGVRSSHTLFTVLSAAFAVWLSKQASRPDVLFDTPFAGRSDVDMHAAIGNFVASLPLRFQVDRELTFLEFLAKAGETLYDAEANRDVLVWNDIFEYPHITSLFVVKFRYFDGLVEGPQFPGVSARPCGAGDGGVTARGLDAALWPVDDRLCGFMGFRAGRYPATEVKGWAGDFVDVLTRISADPRVTVRDLIGNE